MNTKQHKGFWEELADIDTALALLYLLAAFLMWTLKRRATAWIPLFLVYFPLAWFFIGLTFIMVFGDSSADTLCTVAGWIALVIALPWSIATMLRAYPADYVSPPFFAPRDPNAPVDPNSLRARVQELRHLSLLRVFLGVVAGVLVLAGVPVMMACFGNVNVYPVGPSGQETLALLGLIFLVLMFVVAVAAYYSARTNKPPPSWSSPISQPAPQPRPTTWEWTEEEIEPTWLERWTAGWTWRNWLVCFALPAIFILSAVALVRAVLWALI